MASSPISILLLCTDAFGGRGGIAEFNRALCRALCAWPAGCRIVVVPCRVQDPVVAEVIPTGMTYLTGAASGRLRYLSTLVQALRRHGPFDLVLCGHLYLLRGAVLARTLSRAPMAAILHGIEAWQPPPRRTIRWCVPKLDRIVAVSDFTRGRFLSWSGIDQKQTAVVPNAVDLERFSPGPRPDNLAQRHGLTARTVLLTMARLDACERYKGIDEILQVLPGLRSERPDLAYVVAGDGSDRPRLEQRARDLGLADHVRFVGYVPEEEKRDYYRLADAFVMPGRGEGFGIVYLEAMACGVPVVASTADASREAVRDGRLGELADPDSPGSIRDAILRALARSRGERPDGLDYFSVAEFARRWHALLSQWTAPSLPSA